MKYFVLILTYEGYDVEEYGDEESMLMRVNEMVRKNQDAVYRVIEGRELEFVPIEKIIKLEVKR